MTEQELNEARALLTPAYIPNYQAAVAVFAELDRLRLAAAPQLVSEFGQIQNGDTLLVLGRFSEKAEYNLYQHVEKKESQSDGQEVILHRKRNSFFNFKAYMTGQSWVKRCYRLTLPEAPPATPQQESHE